MLDPTILHSTTEFLMAKAQIEFSLPFQDVARDLSRELGVAIPTRGSSVPEEATEIVLGSMGMNLLIFLASSVLVTTAANAIQITPILGYLILGALLGPFFPMRKPMSDWETLGFYFCYSRRVSKSLRHGSANWPTICHWAWRKFL